MQYNVFVFSHHEIAIDLISWTIVDFIDCSCHLILVLPMYLE
jgi:hypothetical protein